LSKVFFENVSVILTDDKNNSLFEELVEKITAFKKEGKNTNQIERQIESIIAEIYSLTTNDIALIESSETPDELGISSIRERSPLFSS
jgi:hypothetical protein